MISIFDLFKIGIGPSSSHTTGPMKAAGNFAEGLRKGGHLASVARVHVTLFGSLAWTGKGHGSDKAVLLGLSGCAPESIEPEDAERQFAEIKAAGRLSLGGERSIAFDLARDLVFDREQILPGHSNAMKFAAFDADGRTLSEETWYSIGGGFVVREGDPVPPQPVVPWPYRSAAELLALADANSLTIADVVLANETVLRPRTAVLEGIDRIAGVMLACIERGIGATGELPGVLKVRRRASSLFKRLCDASQKNVHAPHQSMEYVNVYAIAVNEENAAGGRVVTAPTNGAAGVIPAVLKYYRDHCSDSSQAGVHTFFLTATAIGSLCKMNASISGAEVGCQGEIGVACSMAAAGLTAALGGSNAQIENAAEIGIEHHLGMTCDPVGGLVQIPCIERNAFGAVKAINAASLALRGDGSHRVTLDQVIETMRQTGADMQLKYKETARGGLAVNVPEC
ncbi:MAG TPA: L-serine ammonia-lyase [Pseudolabrys sp.]|jgi:L-serine dehydratase|nr:L-serine ammonia-lyase [Pseudolabrys sp.]